jgi:hypothetical protein
MMETARATSDSSLETCVPGTPGCASLMLHLLQGDESLSEKMPHWTHESKFSPLLIYRYLKFSLFKNNFHMKTRPVRII